MQQTLVIKAINLYAFKNSLHVTNIETDNYKLYSQTACKNVAT